MTETVELKPCKRCGSIDKVAMAPGGNWHVECQDCGYITSGVCGTFEEAAVAWNTRSDPAVRDRVTDEAEPLRFGYTNWRGEYAERMAIPLRIERKESEWHGPGLHWVMVAFDVEKRADRDFLLADMGAQTSPTEPASGQQIADAVLAWMVKHEWLDGGNEYSAADVIDALNDNAAPPAKEPQ